MKFFKIILIFILTSAYFKTYAKEYFVAPNGNDNYPGTQRHPFATIFKASEVAMPGDTVTIMEGEYILKRQFNPLRSGTSVHWILYRGEPHQSVVFDGSLIKSVVKNKDPIQFSTLTEGLFQIQDVNYIRFENITVQHSNAAGFIVRGGKRIELIKCNAHHTHNSGIGLWYCDSVLVKGCEITDANNNSRKYYLAGQKVLKEAPHEALSIAGARYFEVTGNHIHHCNKEGIDVKEISRHGVVHNNIVNDLPRQAYYVDVWFGLLEDIEFYSNTAFKCVWGFGISVEGKNSRLQNVRIHHNLVYNIKGAGVLFSMWGSNLLRTDIYIYNNTFYRCGSPRMWSGGVGSIDVLTKNFQNIFIYHNVFDKGWDYEMGFTFKPEDVKAALKERNFIAAENLFECSESRFSRKGQFGVRVYGYMPPHNQLGTPLYRNELKFDFVPEKIPKVIPSGNVWKYKPSPWFGAFKPMGQRE